MGVTRRPLREAGRGPSPDLERGGGTEKKWSRGRTVPAGQRLRPAPRPGHAGAPEGGRRARPAVASPDLEGGREREHCQIWREGGREKGRGNGRDDDGSVDILLVLARKQRTHRSYEEIRTSNLASNGGN
jgi:hypothetical protein